MVKEETEVWFLTSGMLVNLGNCLYRNRKLIFHRRWAFLSLNFSIFGRYFGKKFGEFDLFWPIFQKFSQKWPIFLEFLPEVVPFPPEVGKFFKFSRYFSKKFEKFALKTLIFSKTGNGSGFSTGSKLFFTKFLMFWAL